jgi:hypothetical protein
MRAGTSNEVTIRKYTQVCVLISTKSLRIGSRLSVKGHVHLRCGTCCDMFSYKQLFKTISNTCTNNLHNNKMQLIYILVGSNLGL